MKIKVTNYSSVIHLEDILVKQADNLVLKILESLYKSLSNMSHVNR